MSSSPSASLLTLPLELRLQIYSHLAADLSLAIRRGPRVGYGRKFRNSTPIKTTCRPRSSGETLLSLLLVCRQIYSEALPVIQSHPKALTFSHYHIDGLTPFPDPAVDPKFISSVTTVLFPTRSGSRLLLEQLPNLRTVGVCRTSLTSSPDLVWEGRNGDTGGPTLAEKLVSMREWLTWVIGEKKFVGSLSQQWIVQYFHRSWYFPELEKQRKRADVWCRVTGLMTQRVVSQAVWSEDTRAAWVPGSEKEMDLWKGSLVIRQAVWVNLDDLSTPEDWRWCVPSCHTALDAFSSGAYNPKLEEKAGDEGLATICRWWGGWPEDEDGEGRQTHQGVPLVWHKVRSHA